MNRILQLLNERAEFPPYDEFFVVSGEFGRVFVTREVACCLRKTFNRLVEPKWLEFRDCTGSLIRVRARLVNVIVESTAATRAADREFAKARRDEDNANQRPWEPD